MQIYMYYIYLHRSWVHLKSVDI